MSEREFHSWREFYKLFPFDDVHRYHRPAAMVAASYGGEYEKRLEFLAPNPDLLTYSQAELNSFKAHGIKPPARN